MTDTTNTPVQIPDAAVQAAAKCYAERVISINDTFSSLAREMLTAALPHLQPVDVEAVRRQAFDEAIKECADIADSHNAFATYDAIRALSAEPAQGEQLKRIGFIDYFSMTAIKHGADFSEITISKAASDIHTYPIYAAPTSEEVR